MGWFMCLLISGSAGREDEKGVERDFRVRFRLSR